MINTVTLNPSIDYIVWLEQLEVGQVNRNQEELILPGGKGINVSIVLSRLGISNTALGFVGGFTGQAIKEMLQKDNVKSNFIYLEQGLSRINVKLKAAKETEVNGSGPEILAYHLEALYTQIEGMCEGDTLVLAGSIPHSVSDTIYKDIMEKLADRKIHIVVDATKDLLKNVLKYKPFLIKPNHHELGELFGVEITNQQEVVSYAKQLQQEGARHVLVSMADKGAVLVTEDGQVLSHSGIKGNVKNSVGAGDSMVAGFLAGYTNSRDLEKAFKLGVAAGSASAFSVDLATQEMILGIYHTL